MKIRTFLLICAVLLVVGSIATSQPTPVAAQEPGKTNPSVAVKKGFEEVSGWVTKSAEMVPAEKYNYKPVDTVRTFGQLVAHITDSYNFFCARGAGQKNQWSDAVEKGTIDKATLVPKLKEAVDKCNTVYGSESSQVVPLFENVAHTNLHYGNLITYLRMMGMKPPSS
jgi:DinB superfamily